MTPTLDIKVNIGNTTLTESFLNDLKAALVALGADVGKVNLMLTSAKTLSAGDPTLWDIYDHTGDWEERANEDEDDYTDADGNLIEYTGDDHYYYPNMNPGSDNDMTNDPHIIAAADGGTLYFYGYGEPAYHDFMLSKTDSDSDKQLKFTIDENTASYHTLVGSGFLFNAKVEDNLLYSYAVVVTEVDIQLLQIDGVDITEFHDNWDDSLQELKNVSILYAYEKPDVTVHNLEIGVVGNKISILDNGEYLDAAPSSPLEYEAFSQRYAALDNGKSLSDYWWSNDEKAFVMDGYKDIILNVPTEDIDEAGGEWEYLVLEGYSPEDYDSTYDDSGDYCTLTVWEYDYYHYVLLPVDSEAVIDDYGVAGDYLYENEIPYDEVDEYGMIDSTGQYYIAYNYDEVTRDSIMDDAIAAADLEGIDISDYDDDWVEVTDEGAFVIWQYYNATDDDYYEYPIPYTYFDPDFVLSDSSEFILPETLGNRFGPFVAYSNHGCSSLTAVAFSNLRMNVMDTVDGTLSENAEAQEYIADSQKYFINLQDTVVSGLDTGALAALFKSQGVSYIGVGMAASQAQHDAIKTAAESGMTLLKTDTALIDKLAKYIYNIVKAQTIENIIETYPIETTVTYEDGTVETEGLDSAVDILDDLVAGNTVELRLDLSAYITEDVPAEDKALVKDYIDSLSDSENRDVLFIDIELIKIVTGESGSVETPITETLRPITISIVLPENMRGMFNYKMVRIHDGVLEVLTSTYDPATFTLTFTTDKFSTYGVSFSSKSGSTSPDTGDAGTAIPILGMLLAAGAIILVRRRRMN
jgi:LPXTG-motif cell wall-anchored protein